MAIYLKIDGINGNSLDESHTDWIEVQTWTWGATNMSNVGQGGGAAVGTSDVQPITLTVTSAKSSVEMMHRCITGKHLGDITLEATKTTGEKEDKWLKIELKDALISGMQMGGDSSGYGIDTVTIQYEEHKHEIFEQDKKGILASAGVHTFNVGTRVAT